MEPLSSAHLASLAGAQQLLLAPLTHPSPEVWMAAVNAELKTLFGAEGAIFILTLPTGPRVITDLDAGVMASYFAHFAATDEAPAMLEQFGGAWALEEDTQHVPLHTQYVKGEAFNDWYRPLGMNRTISLRAYGRPTGVPSLAMGFSDTLTADIVLGGSAAAQGPKTGPARTLLALLQPALSAGVNMLQQTLGHPASERPSGFASPHVAAVLDGMATAVWLFDEAGRFLHHSAAATRLVLGLVEGSVLHAAAEQHARALLRGYHQGTPVSPSCTVEVGGERVRLVGAYLRPPSSRSPAVLVRAEGAHVVLPSEETVRARFDLTPQEARVAHLRARGVETAAIADRLSVSVHTVRRHTERVLTKLDVRRAAEIGPLLLAMSGNGAAQSS
ncbi:MAG: helix-turn-helix transcriptional regulator [Rhodothermales bacterium]